MIFRQITHDDLGCASYLIGDEDAGVAAVVDPRLAIDEYLRLARYFGVSIEHILETHNHADHVSGHGRLAAATGATIHVNRVAEPSYDHEAIDDGWELELGALRVRAVHTPGHRPEHTAFALIDTARGPEPWAVLTGDTLFVGDIARPDLAVDPEDGAPGHLPVAARAPAGLSRRGRGLARPSRRLDVRRSRDGHEGLVHGGLRARPQRAARRDRRAGLRGPRPGDARPPAAELPQHRRPEPGPADHRARRPPAADPAPGRAQALRGRLPRRRAHRPAVRRRPHPRRGGHHDPAGRVRLQAGLAGRPRDRDRAHRAR